MSFEEARVPETKESVNLDQWIPDFDNPEDLTPDERLAHIVRILAIGSIRLAEEESQTKNDAQKTKVLEISLDGSK